MAKALNLKRLIDRLQSLLANNDAKVYVVDHKDRYFEIINVDSEFADQVVIDIVREKEDYKL